MSAKMKSCFLKRGHPEKVRKLNSQKKETKNLDFLEELYGGKKNHYYLGKSHKGTSFAHI